MKITRSFSRSIIHSSQISLTGFVLSLFCVLPSSALSVKDAQFSESSVSSSITHLSQTPVNAAQNQASEQDSLFSGISDSHLALIGGALALGLCVLNGFLRYRLEKNTRGFRGGGWPGGGYGDGGGGGVL